MADTYEIEIVPTVTSKALGSIAASFSLTFTNGLLGGLQEASKKLVGFGSNQAAGLATGAGQVAGAAVAVANPALAAVGVISSVANSIGGMVSKAKPAVMDMFTAALDDVQAVVGRALIPVFQILTPLMQMMGDFIASILPDQKQMNDLMKAFQPILDILKSGLQALAPVIKFVNDLFVNVLITALEKVAEAIQWVVDVVTGPIKAVLALAREAEAKEIERQHAAGQITTEEAAYRIRGLQGDQEKKEMDEAHRARLQNEAAAGSEYARQVLAGSARADAESGFARSARGAAASGAEFKGIGELGDQMIVAAWGSVTSPAESLASIRQTTEQILTAVQGGVAGMMVGVDRQQSNDWSAQ